MIKINKVVGNGIRASRQKCKLVESTCVLMAISMDEMTRRMLLVILLILIAMRTQVDSTSLHFCLEARIPFSITLHPVRFVYASEFFCQNFSMK